MEGIVCDSHQELSSVDVGVDTAQGARPSQMDRYYVDKAANFERRGYALFIIFDGHGDVRFADHAKEHLARYILNDPEFSKGNYREALNNAFEREERALWEAIGSLERGGTTVTVALLLRVPQVCYFANVGDSTAVLAARSNSSRPSSFAIQATVDDKINDPKEHQRLVQARAHFRKGGIVRASHRINMTRALGDFDFKAQETNNGIDWISAVPHIHRVTLDPNDHGFILLASDGLWNVFNADQVVDAVQTEFQMGYGAQKITENLICETVNSAFRPDNATAIVVRLIWRRKQHMEI